jgi:hypothetical protein
MKIDRLDVAHEEITDNCDEYIIISAESKVDDADFDSTEELITRAYVKTDGEILREILVEEMLNSKKFANFVKEVVNEYNQLNSEL